MHQLQENDDYEVHQGTPLALTADFGELLNDQDDPGQDHTASLVQNPQHGTLTFNADGSFTYTPHAGFRRHRFVHLPRSATASPAAWPRCK